ncbi:hypothetical protein ACHAWO_012714 [Cyclotella atomus]|uniref:Uncharacterized protein n=1 Tax=Cyclotella atomus TaxID=382360 RepID=A0ABD3Q6M5_9STRA
MHSCSAGRCRRWGRESLAWGYQFARVTTNSYLPRCPLDSNRKSKGLDILLSLLHTTLKMSPSRINVRYRHRPLHIDRRATIPLIINGRSHHCSTSTDLEFSPPTEVTKDGLPPVSTIPRMGLPAASLNVTSFNPEITTSDSFDFTKNCKVDPMAYGP